MVENTGMERERLRREQLIEDLAHQRDEAMAERVKLRLQVSRLTNQHTELRTEILRRLNWACMNETTVIGLVGLIKKELDIDEVLQGAKQ